MQIILAREQALWLGIREMGRKEKGLGTNERDGKGVESPPNSCFVCFSFWGFLFFFLAAEPVHFASWANMLVLRTSNFQVANIRPIVLRKEHFIVHH